MTGTSGGDKGGRGCLQIGVGSGETVVADAADCRLEVMSQATVPFARAGRRLETDAQRCRGMGPRRFVAHSESINDGLSLSLFSVEEKVQIDLLQTLKRLWAPMISYDEIMRWASRSCLLWFTSLSMGYISIACSPVIVESPSILALQQKFCGQESSTPPQPQPGSTPHNFAPRLNDFFRG
jgi:hypothetical protein